MLLKNVTKFLNIIIPYLQVQYPQGIKTGYKTFKHIHDKDKRPRDQKRYHNQWEVIAK